MKIESIYDYLDLPKNEFKKLVKSIYKITDFITEDYPDYKEWFFKKQLDGVLNGERNILFVRNLLNSKEIIAVASLKKSKNEKKICTLYVKDKYRNMGIGGALVEVSMNWLETRNPMITFPAYKLIMFNNLINKYNWQLTEVRENNDICELCFNGKILSRNLKRL